MWHVLPSPRVDGVLLPLQVYSSGSGIVPGSLVAFGGLTMIVLVINPDVRSITVLMPFWALRCYWVCNCLNALLGCYVWIMP